MGEEKLRKNEWAVVPIDIDTARTLVENFHYAKSSTNTRVYTHGLFRKGEECNAKTETTTRERAKETRTEAGDYVTNSSQNA